MKILSWLSRRKAHSEQSDRATSQEIVADYGRMLESAPAPIGVVADVDELPYSKEEIKKAILTLLVIIEDLEIQKILCEAYYSLASWQPGVGPKRLGIDLTEYNAELGAENLMKISASFLEAYKEWKMWESVVSKEQDHLLEDLRKLGF